MYDSRQRGIKTEHNGAKHGNGAYWGRKKEAKKFSNIHRRFVDRQLAQGNYEMNEIYEDA